MKLRPPPVHVMAKHAAAKARMKGVTSGDALELRIEAPDAEVGAAKAKVSDQSLLCPAENKPSDPDARS